MWAFAAGAKSACLVLWRGPTYNVLWKQQTVQSGSALAELR